MESKDPIISYLLEEQVLEEPVLERLVQEQGTSGKSLISLLKSHNLVTQDQLTKIVALSNNITFVNLSPDMVDPLAVKLVPYDIARQDNLIPVKIEKDKLYVAMSSPLNL